MARSRVRVPFPPVEQDNGNLGLPRVAATSTQPAGGPSPADTERVSRTKVPMVTPGGVGGAHEAERAGALAEEVREPGTLTLPGAGRGGGTEAERAGALAPESTRELPPEEEERITGNPFLDAPARTGFRPEVDVPTNFAEAIQTFMQPRPAEFANLYIDKTTGGVYNTAGTGVDPVLEARFIQHMQRQGLVFDILDKASDLRYQMSLKGAQTNEEIRKARAEHELTRKLNQESRDFDLQRQKVEQDFTREQNALTRAISAGNLEETIRANKAQEGLEARKFELTQRQFKVQMLLAFASNPRLFGIVKQQGLLSLFGDMGFDLEALVGAVGEAPGGLRRPTFEVVGRR